MNENTQRVYQCIEGYTRAYGFSPTMREVASDCGLAVSTVHKHINWLREEQLVTMVPGTMRTLRVV